MNKNIEIPQNIFKFAQKYKYLIEREAYDELYYYALKEISVTQLTEMLLSAGINPLEHLSTIPEDFLFYAYLGAADVANITSINLGDRTYQYIEEHAFTGSNIVELDFIDSNLQAIESQAFYGSKLRKIILPDTLKRIEHSAFAYCDDLKDIWYEGSFDQWKEIQKGIDWKAGISGLKLHMMRDRKLITFK